MSKFVVVILSKEDQAYEAVRAIKELHDEGSISLYGFAVVAKDLDGTISIKQEADTGPLGAAVGAIVGGLVGMLGGPIGTVVGMAGGAMIGGFGRLFNLGLGSEFVEKTSTELVPGKIAIVAEVDESWESPLDTRMKALHATVLRSWRSDIEDERMSADVARWKGEFESLKAELDHAGAAAKASLKGRMDHAKSEFDAAQAKAKVRVDVLNKELQAKITTLEAQFASNKHAVKDKLEQRIAALRASYNARAAKFSQAWDLTKEGLAA